MLSLFCVCLCLLSSSIQAQQNPNIILISGDDVGWNDLGVYGHPVHTPSLDRMAAEGIRFNQFYVTTSSCSPSRAAVWTGKYPHATGAENLHDPLPADQWVISGYLKGQGYYTANVGKLHLGERPAILAQYDLILPEVFKNGQKPTDHSGIDEFLDRRPKDRPFFLGIGYTEAHRPFKHRTPIPQPHTPDKVEVPPYLADLPEVRQDLVDYYDEINFMDASIGRLMQRLRDEGIEDNTVIFLRR
jgi:arylsulfatase A-like enzyme